VEITLKIKKSFFTKLCFVVALSLPGQALGWWNPFPWMYHKIEKYVRPALFTCAGGAIGAAGVAAWFGFANASENKGAILSAAIIGAYLGHDRADRYELMNLASTARSTVQAARDETQNTKRLCEREFKIVKDKVGLLKQTLQRIENAVGELD